MLVANRGEIAVRIIRACREAGIESVAVYSDVDAAARHVRQADRAIHIGPAPAAESYLQGERIIEAALRAGADAVHPGYGFLSESASFAALCEAAGLVFIGPRPETLAALGDKLAARRSAADAGVPLVPGTFDPIATETSDGLEKVAGTSKCSSSATTRARSSRWASETVRSSGGIKSSSRKHRHRDFPAISVRRCTDSR